MLCLVSNLRSDRNLYLYVCSYNKRLFYQSYLNKHVIVCINNVHLLVHSLFYRPRTYFTGLSMGTSGITKVYFLIALQGWKKCTFYYQKFAVLINGKGHFESVIKKLVIQGVTTC